MLTHETQQSVVPTDELLGKTIVNNSYQDKESEIVAPKRERK